MSDQDFKEKVLNKLSDIERKTDTIHAGIYGDINSKGLKKTVDEHSKLLAPQKFVSKIPKGILIGILLLLLEGFLEVKNAGIITSLITLFAK